VDSRHISSPTASREERGRALLRAPLVGSTAWSRVRVASFAPLIGVLGVLLLGFAGEVRAAPPKQLGQFEKWGAYVVETQEGKHCFVYSEPTDMKGDYSKRDPVSVSISHRPKADVRDEISFSAGYPLKPDSEVEVVIDGAKRFRLFVEGESAWAKDSKTDARLREEIEKGSKMVVKGVSSRGTKTTDTYSLSGTSKALEKIDSECKK